MPDSFPQFVQSQAQSRNQIDHFLAGDPSLADGDGSREFRGLLNQRPVFQVGVHFSTDADGAFFNASSMQIESRILKVSIC